MATRKAPTKASSRPKVAKAAKGETPSNFVVRPKKLVASPPGTLGWSSLVQADDKYGEPKFNLKCHFSEDAAGKLGIQIQEMMDELIPKLEENIKEKGGKIKLPLKRISGDQYLEDNLKDPVEKSRVQLPTLGFSVVESYKGKDGNSIKRTIKAWDSKNAPLDLPTLRLGMGSIVQVVYEPGVYAGPLTKGYAHPTLRLVGVRILKLEQFGPGAAQLGDLSEEDLEGLDADFEADDLAAYARRPDKPNAHEDAPEPSHANLDDEIPF